MTLCVSPPHRFQTPFMAFGEGLAGVRLVLQMSIDRVAPVIRRSDCDDRPVHLANAGLDRRDAEDRAIGMRRYNLAFTDLDIVRPPVGRLNDRSEEHTSELQSLMRISYAVFCLKKKKIKLIIAQ